MAKEFTAQEEQDLDWLERMREKHDIKYRVEVVIDNEVVRTLESNSFEIATSYKNEDLLEQSINEYMRDMYE